MLVSKPLVAHVTRTWLGQSVKCMMAAAWLEFHISDDCGVVPDAKILCTWTGQGGRSRLGLEANDGKYKIALRRRDDFEIVNVVPEIAEIRTVFPLLL